MNPANLKRTPLYALHLEKNARMVPFAGYEMPVQYPMGIKQEHLHCRAQAGLFDVSHMGQFLIRGASASTELEKLIPVDLQTLTNNQQRYGLFTNDQGGILDDLMISRWSDDTFYIVVNAACKDQDMLHLQKKLNSLDIQSLDDRALLALQGPTAKDVMLKIAPQSASLTFMSSCKMNLAGVECYVSRSGYTGEDGFEISLPAAEAADFARHLLSFDEVEAIGLGARDTLRLEAGLCLYGHDINTDTTPVEASLSWSISNSRRSDGSNAGGFPGSDIILQQMTAGKAKQRVGLLVEGRRMLREGAEIFDASDKLVGVITSGGFSPTLEAPIAMAYIQTSAIAKADETFHAIVRDNTVPVKLTKMPFVAQRYFRG